MLCLLCAQKKKCSVVVAVVLLHMLIGLDGDL